MITNYINKLPDKSPEFRFTGNLFNRFPELKEMERLNDNDRIRYCISPIAHTWYFKRNGKPFNFYPIFLHLTSEATGIKYDPCIRKLDLFDAAKIAASYSRI